MKTFPSSSPADVAAGSWVGPRQTARVGPVRVDTATVPEELSAEIDRVTQREVYENTVLFVRPLGFIEPTAARQISYADALAFEAIHEAVYRDHGFQLVDIAPGSVAERVATVEARIAGEQNGRDKEPTGSSH